LLVAVGLKTPGPNWSRNGPVRPFHSISTDWLANGFSACTPRGDPGRLSG